jgi:hypothetical protein
MNLLAATLYDPAVAVSKATSALLAMTVFDTVNLALAVTVPAHGKLRVRMVCTITGATTVPTVLLGVMNHTGGAVLGRQTPLDFPGTMNAATQSCPCIVDFIITGLTPGALTLDAAYAVQVVVAATNIKYGGPNTNAGANAWGGFLFEIWDPQPMTLALDGAVNVKQWNGTNVAAPATAGIPEVNVKNINNVSASPVTTIKAVQGLTTADTIVTTTNLTNLPSIPANWLTAAGIAASALNGKGDWNIGKTGYALSAAGVQAIWDVLTSALATVGSIGKLLVDNINATISSRSTYAGGDTSGTTTLLSRLTAGRATNLDNLDATVSSRLATAGYTAPDNADIVLIKAKTDNLPVDPADASDIAASFTTVNSNIATVAGYVDTEVAAIKAKTDNLPSNPAATTDIPTADQNADALLKRDWTAISGEASRSVLNALRFVRNKFSTTATPGSVTVYKEDDATIAFTKTVTTDPAAEPIVEG